MLFHITQTHSPTNCSAHKPERQAAFGQVMEMAEAHGVTLHGVYADAPGHTVYILAEADSAMALAKLLDPVLEYGHNEIRPVADARALMAELEEDDK